MPDAVADFINRHPRVQISLDVDNWEKLSRALLREEIEFFVADIRDFEADPNFQTRPLTRAAAFFCRPQHPLLGKDSLSTNDLFNYPLASTLIPRASASCWRTSAARSTSPPTSAARTCTR